MGPVVTVADATVFAQRVTWTEAAGMTPGTVAIVFEASAAEKVLAASKGGDLASLRVRHELGGFGKPVAIDYEIPALLLLEPDRSLSPYETTLTFGDVRTLFQGLRVSASYNVRRETAELLGLDEDANGTRSDDAGTGIHAGAGSVAKPPDGEVGDQLAQPGAMVRHFARARQDYLEWTIQRDGTPYTALGICRHLVRAALDQVDPSHAATRNGLASLAAALATISEAVTRNHYFRSDVLVRSEAFPEVLDQWLERAEVGVAPEPGKGGRFRAWWTGDDRPLTDAVKGMPPTVDGGGAFAFTELKRVRASRVNVRFPRQQEVFLRLVGDTRLPGEPGGPTGTDVDLPAVVNVQDPGARVAHNVLQLPDTVDYLGARWHKGTWVSLGFAMELWTQNPDPTKNVDRLDPDGANLRFAPLLRELGKRSADWSKLVRENWFPADMLSVLASLVQVGDGFRPDPLWSVRMGELRKRYLQTWMVDPSLYRYVLEIRPERARTVSAVDGLQASPYVSCDHAEVYNFSLPELRKLGHRGKGAANVPGEENPAKAVGAPASLAFESRKDVFTVQYDAKYSAKWVDQVVPSLLVEDTIPPQADFAALLASGNPEIQRAWHNCRLRRPDEFRGFVVVSMVFGTNPRPDRDGREGRWQREALTHGVVVPALAAGWPGETNPELAVEMVSGEETARFGLADDLNVADVPVNAKALEALATAHARRYYHRQRDRMRGRFTVPGWDPAYKLFGSLRTLTVTLTDQGILSTTFDATQPPAPPDLRSLLPDPVRQAVFRELPVARADRRALR